MKKFTLSFQGTNRKQNLFASVGAVSLSSDAQIVFTQSQDISGRYVSFIAEFDLQQMEDLVGQSVNMDVTGEISIECFDVETVDIGQSNPILLVSSSGFLSILRETGWERQPI